LEGHAARLTNMGCATVQRVQNLRLWKAYYSKRADLAEDLGGACVCSIALALHHLWAP